MGVVVMHLPPNVLRALNGPVLEAERKEAIAKRLVRRWLCSSRGPAVTTYRFDGPRATIIAARYGR